MGLSIYLINKGQVTFDGGKTFEDYQENVFESDITHNLASMADASGLYDVLWDPDSINVKKAQDAIIILEKGLNELESNPEKYRLLNPSNGWGSYEGLVSFTKEFLSSCRENPNAIIYAT